MSVFVVVDHWDAGGNVALWKFVGRTLMSQWLNTFINRALGTGILHTEEDCERDNRFVTSSANRTPFLGTALSIVMGCILTFGWA